MADLTANDSIWNAPRAPASRAKALADGMRTVHVSLVRPFLNWRALREGAGSGLVDACYRELPKFRALTIPDRATLDRTRGRIQADMAGPLCADAAKRMGELADAIEAQPFDLAKVRMIVALMVDSFPNARPHSPETYIEALVQQIEADEYSSAVVANACDAVVRKSTFLPSVSEVLEKCEAAEREADNLIHLARLARAVIQERAVFLDELEHWAADRWGA